MHITNQEQLRKQKRKLSLIFTLILFAVITGLQVIFLIGRYLEYSNREFRKIEDEIFPRRKMMETIISGNMMENIPPMSMGMNPGKWWKLRWWNMIVYNHQQNRILSSSLGDDELTKELLHNIIPQKQQQWTIIYNKNKFLFVKDPIVSGNQSFFLMPVQMGMSDLIRDIFLFVLFFWICSLVFYRVIYRFVGRIFIPIEENIKDMEQFIFNAWHELKTPLSVIKSYLELSLAKKQYQNAINESIKEVDKMNNLLDVLINTSLVHQETEKQQINIEEETKYILSQYTQLLKEKNINVSIKTINSGMCTANKWHFHMLVSNLISNAIKYNKKGGKITITIDTWMWKIQDTGIGIPNKDQEKIFDRFYQVGNIRNKDWFGIWLALVKKIIEIYSRKISVYSQEKKGTTFIIKF